MKSSPIALRLASGSVTPARAEKKRSEASTKISRTPKFFSNVSMTWSASFRRIRPVSTCTQVS